MQAAYPECICPPARQEKGKGREEKGKKERGGRSASCVWLAELSGNRVHWLELCHVVTCAFPEVTPTHLLTSHWLERCHVATQTFLAVSSIPLLTSHWSELCHMATSFKRDFGALVFVLGMFPLLQIQSSFFKKLIN